MRATKKEKSAQKCVASNVFLEEIKAKKFCKANPRDGSPVGDCRNGNYTTRPRLKSKAILQALEPEIE